jgi:hypothetical protein
MVRPLRNEAEEVEVKEPNTPTPAVVDAVNNPFPK